MLHVYAIVPKTNIVFVPDSPLWNDPQKRKGSHKTILEEIGDHDAQKWIPDNQLWEFLFLRLNNVAMCFLYMIAHTNASQVLSFSRNNKICGQGKMISVKLN